MITNTYRTIVPEHIRLFIYHGFLKKLLFYKRNFHILYKAFLAYRFKAFAHTDLYNTLRFIGQYGLRSCPGEFSLKYDQYPVEIWRDNFPYVIHGGKKLYFPQSFSDAAIVKLYRSLITEQDIESAHRYSLDTADFQNVTLFDIGAAEGILTLENIDHIQAAYLVECEAQWVEALQKTFAPYQDKVHIIFKYIDQQDSDNSICLDTLGKDFTGQKVFVKMDIEGFEKKALLGGKAFLERNKGTAAVCTYHHPSHPKEIKELLESYGYQTNFSEGYLYWGLRLSKALVRAKKQAISQQ